MAEEQKRFLAKFTDLLNYVKILITNFFALSFYLRSFVKFEKTFEMTNSLQGTNK